MVVPEVRLKANKSGLFAPLPSIIPGTKSVARLSKAIIFPSPLNAASALVSLQTVFTVPFLWLTRVVAPVERSYRKTLLKLAGPFCPAARLAATLSYAIKLPSALMMGWMLKPFPVVMVEPLAWLTRVIPPLSRSNRKTSSPLLESVCPFTKFVAELKKATKRPSELIDPVNEESLPDVLAEALV